jgi:hypothetical protein
MKQNQILTWLAVGVAVYLLTRRNAAPPLSPANPTNNAATANQAQTAVNGPRVRAYDGEPDYSKMCI